MIASDDLAIREESFEEWLTTEKSHLAGSTLRLFEKLTEQETGQARVAAAQHLVALDPLRESSQRNLMQAYADAGENGLALKQYEKCRELLKHELGIEPSKETHDLIPTAIEHDSSGLSACTLVSLPLVGRDQGWGSLRTNHCNVLIKE